MVGYGYHFIQSFNGKEVSAEECNDIGIELAECLWGDKYQVLVCTHVDKDNVLIYGMIIYLIDYKEEHNSRYACGGYYRFELNNSVLYPHPYQESICW